MVQKLCFPNSLLKIVNLGSIIYDNYLLVEIIAETFKYGLLRRRVALEIITLL